MIVRTVYYRLPFREFILRAYCFKTNDRDHVKMAALSILCMRSTYYAAASTWRASRFKMIMINVLSTRAFNDSHKCFVDILIRFTAGYCKKKMFQKHDS